MKNNHLALRVMVFSFVVFLAGCSSNKKETAENHESHDASNLEGATQEVKAFENVEAIVKTQLSGFLAQYFVLNKALIDDNQEDAKAAAKKLEEKVKQFDMTKLMGEQMDFYHLQAAKLNQGLKGIDQSADIEETRLELAVISEGMYALVKAYHPNNSELYYQFCPMAKNGEGANWLSSTQEIVNPYMGQRMLACGRTTETLK